MRNESFSTTVTDAVDFAAKWREPQARRKVSPFIQLAAARARRTLRITLAPMPRRPLRAAEQAALAAMRAAELAAWQASGGDAWRRRNQSDAAPENQSSMELVQ